MDTQLIQDLVRRYFCRLLNDRDLSVCDELLAPNYVDHDAPEGTPPGPQNTKTFVAQFLDDHPELHVTVEDLVVESNKATARLIWTGTNRHTGARFHQMGIVILHLNESGQIVERWSAYTPLGES
jgi:hypothetical protein